MKYPLSYEGRCLLATDFKMRCGICGATIRYALFHSRSSAYVDYDHKTGEVRGLLCVDCNAGLQRLRANAAVLAQAIEYLERGTWTPSDTALATLVDDAARELGTEVKVKPAPKPSVKRVDAVVKKMNEELQKELKPAVKAPTPTKPLPITPSSPLSDILDAIKRENKEDKWR